MNEHPTKKSTWALCLSIAAILLCLLVFALWAFEVMPHSVITPETFIGTCVTLLGVIVTMAVGWQIYNAIEVKEKIAEIDRLQQKQEGQEHRMEQMYCNASCAAGHAMAAVAESRKDYVDAFRWTLVSLKFSLWMDKPMNVSEMLADLQRYQEKIPADSTYPKKFIDEIYEHDKSIRACNAYNFFVSQYEKIFAEFLQKVKVVEM